MRHFLVIVTAMLTAGCIERHTSTLDDGRVLVRYWDAGVGHGFAGHELEDMATDVCPGGFTVDEDRVVPHDSGKPAYE